MYMLSWFRHMIMQLILPHHCRIIISKLFNINKDHLYLLIHYINLLSLLLVEDYILLKLQYYKMQIKCNNFHIFGKGDEIVTGLGRHSTLNGCKLSDCTISTLYALQKSHKFLGVSNGSPIEKILTSGRPILLLIINVLLMLDVRQESY